jgi:hypothetical protein
VSGGDPKTPATTRDGWNWSTGCWLVCQEPDCGRKYPIRDDIPVMLIEEGDKWIHVAVEDLPVPATRKVKRKT